MRELRTPMQRALARVVNNGGLVTDTNPNSASNPKAVCRAWESAKAKGWLRRMRAPELERLLETKRSAREVILATLIVAALDEARDPFWTQPVPSVHDCCEALQSVTTDIFFLTQMPHIVEDQWTLTESGVAQLGDIES
jgi:hypothetical protein